MHRAFPPTGSPIDSANGSAQSQSQPAEISLIRLHTLALGESGVIRELQTPSFEIRRTLMEMGLIKGTVVSVIRVAPLGDPIEIELRGYRLSLRRKEAEAVIIRRNS